MTTMTTAQIALLTAEVTGDAPRGAATKEAAARRFQNALAEEVGAELAAKIATEILACDFENAKEKLDTSLNEADEAKRAHAKQIEPCAIEATEITSEQMDTYAEAQAAAKPVDAGPGLARLRAKPEAEAVRLAVLEDEKAVAAINPRTKSRAALKLVEAIAPETAKPAREKKARAPKADKAPGKRAAILEAAKRGDLPAAPDFSADTHKRFRAKLAQIVAAAEAGDADALRAFEINPVSSSPKAMAKYRDLCLIAIEARQAKDGAAA